MLSISQSEKIPTNLSVLGVFCVQILGACVSFFVQTFIARRVDVNIYGEFSIIINFINIAVLIILMGTTQVVLRMISVYHVHAMSRVRYIYNASISFLISNWVLISSMILILVWGQLTPFLKSDIFTVGLMILLILLNGFVILFQNASRATGHVFGSMWPSLLLRPVVILLVMGVFFFMDQQINLNSLLVFQVVGVGTVCILFSFNQKDLFSLPKNTNFLLSYKNAFNRSKAYFINGLLQNLVKNLDIVLVGIVLSSYSAGLFAAANKINILMIFALSSMNVVFSPQIAKWYHEKKFAQLNRELERMSIFVGLLAFSIFLIMLFFGKQLLILFGEEYVSIYPVLIVLIGANLIEVLFGPTGVILNMTGHQRQFNKVMLVVLASFVVLMPVALYTFGLIGAASATVIITVLKNGMQWRYIYLKLKIHTGLISSVVTYLKLVR